MTIPNLPPIDNAAVDVPQGRVIKDANVRKWVGIGLWSITLAAAVLSMFVSYFPEAAGDGDTLQRGIAFTNALVSFLAGSFGLVVTLPNTKN